jgi:hypothetical protein
VGIDFEIKGGRVIESKLYIRYHQLIYFRISKNKDIGGYVAITGSQASDILICELVIK